jgi:alcohol dehydrogenase (cytochrome c)
MTLGKTLRTAAFLLPSLLLPSALLMGQGKGVAPAELLKPLKDSWPTYNGDYTGRRYSALSLVNKSNVMHLTLAWSLRVTPGAGNTGGGRGGRGGGARTIIGGEGPGDIATGGGSIKASVLEVDGTLYFTAPDNAWAVDARDGRELWHYFWKTKGGTHIGNRGLAMWNSYLFMETPDDYLVSLDARTGQERWHKTIADLAQGYFSTPAPIVVGNHVLVGTGNDIDAPGFLQSFDPETGNLQWKIYTVPMKPGDPGLDTWASLDAARHGGSQEPTIPKPSSISSALAILLRHLRTALAGRETTYSPARWSPSTWTLARWPGITRRRLTTCTITIRPKHPC